MSAAPLFDERGQLEAVACSFTDVTECRRAEEALNVLSRQLRAQADELRALNEDLEWRVAERTAGLEQENRGLRQSEGLYRTLVENLGDSVHFKDTSGRFVLANEELLRRVGLTLDQVIGKTAWEVYDKEVAAQIVEQEQRVLATGEPHAKDRFEIARQRAAVIEVRKVPVKNSEGEIAGIITVARDITEQKRAEDELVRLNRALRTVTASNRALVHATGEQDLLEAVCRIVVEEGGYRMAWVGMALDDEEKTVQPVAWAGHDDGYLASRKFLWADTDFGRCATGRAIRSGKPVLVRDLVSDPMTRLWSEETRKRGYGAHIALPLAGESGAFGSLGIYAETGAVFDDQEIALLEDLAGDLAFGVLALRLRVHHAQAEDELRRMADSLRQGLAGTIRALAAVTEMRDPYTAGHQKRVSHIAWVIARGLGVDSQMADGIRMAASIHDLGKIGVPAEILNKPSRLNANELSIIKTHAEAGGRLLAGIEFPWPLAEMIAQHHERMDGSGYPDGLKGEGIILGARIIAVADVIEAMSSHRPYRPALSVEEALREIKQGRGTFYDPDVVDECLLAFRSGGFNLV